MRRILLLAMVSAFLSAAPTAAQETAPLGDVLNSLAGLWARGDATAIADMAASSGVEVELAGATVGVISGRKLAAALRRVFDDRVTVAVQSKMTSAVRGAEDRAFGELRWELRVGGATLSEEATVFLALVHEPVGWRVTQIRILE